MQAVSATLAAAYAAGVQYPDTVVDVVPRGADLSTPALATLAIVGGTADLDQTRPVRRQLQGLRVPIGGPNDSLVPRRAGDLLHPVTGNELRVLYGRNWRGGNLLDPESSDFEGGLGLWDPQVSMATVGWSGTWGQGVSDWNNGAVVRGNLGKTGKGCLIAINNGLGGDMGAQAVWGQLGDNPRPVAGARYVACGWVMGLNAAPMVFAPTMGLWDPGTNAYVNQANTAVVNPALGGWTPWAFAFTCPATLPPRAALAIWFDVYNPSGNLPQDVGLVAVDALGIFMGGPADATRTLTPTVEHNEVGYFGLQGTPSLVDSDGDLLLTLAGADRTATLQRFRWTKPLQIRGNTTIPDAIRILVANRWPRKALPLRVDFSACAGHPVMDQTIPNSVFGSDANASDVVGDIQALATAGQCEVYFGGDGTLRVVPYVQVGTNAPVVTFSDGVNAGAMVHLQRDMDPSKVFNGVVVTGGNSTDRAVRGEWWDTDPTSPTYVETYGEVAAYWDTPLVRDQRQADAVARALGSRLRLGAEALQLQTVPHGAYEGSDAMAVTSDRDGVDGVYLLEKWSGLDLSESPQPMTITSRTTNQTFGEAVT